MAQTYKVTTRGKLLAFLFENLEGWSKKTIKQRLQNGSVLVNGEVKTRHDHLLSAGDHVQVGSIQKTHKNNLQNQKLEILYQDKDLIAINKPAGLLSVGNNKENKQHALALLRSQLSRTNRGIKLWPVHRLDRDTSGILLFATSKEMREAVMSQWSSTEKKYLAIVEGTPMIASDTISQPLRADEKEYRMHVGAHKDAKPAITHYNVKESFDKRSLLEIQIETGRQHQIRAHLAWLGHPVVGDVRYGKKSGRMGLHAMGLKFVHPLTKKEVRLELDAPHDFYTLLKTI